MILTTHVLAGAVIGKNIESSWIVVLLSVAIHFLMDSLRHGEYVETFNPNTSLKNSGWKVILDLAIGFSFIFVFLHYQTLGAGQINNTLLGAFSSALPDFITFLFWKFRWKFLEKYYAFHSWAHKYPRQAPERRWTLRNLANDIVISALAIILLLVK